MKVWRGFTLTVWTALLAACVTLALLYHALSSTVLDPDRTKRSLAQSGTYETVRDTVLTDAVMREIDDRYPENRLIDREVIKATLAEAMPAATLAERFDPAVTAIYRWLDSKEQDLTFSVSLRGYEEAFYRSLEKRLSGILTSLESCGDNRYPPEDAVLNDRCLPGYLSADEATQAAMGYLRAGDFPLDGTVTERVILGETGKSTGFQAIPSYLNILWTLNILALVIGGIVASFLLITRRTVGLIAVGIGLFFGGVSVLSALLIITLVTAPLASTELGRTLAEALLEPFALLATQLAVAAMAGGAVILTAGVLWRRRRRA